MKPYLMCLAFFCYICCFQNIFAKESSLSSVYLASREGDPASLVENVSVINGDYSEVETDRIVPAPDSLVFSRFYSSQDSAKVATFGGWRFKPECFLSFQKDSKGKTFSNGEGNFERFYAYVGNPDGSIFTYVGWKNTSNTTEPTLFKVDLEETHGVANTARKTPGSWNNQKNNQLFYHPQTDSFELFLCSEGKRFYKKHPSLDIYVLSHEILPSGNKIFYEINNQGEPS